MKKIENTKEIISAAADDASEEFKIKDDLGERDENAEEHHHHYHHHHHHSGEHHHHHHSHHHSSRRHSKSRHKKTSNNSKKSKLDKYIVGRIVLFGLVFLLLLALFFVIYHYESGLKHNDNDKNEAGEPEETLVLDGNLALEPFWSTGDVDIIDPIAKECFELPADGSVLDVIKNHHDEKDSTFDKSVPVVIKQKLHNVPEGMTIEGYVVEISENKDLSKAKRYEFSADESIEIEYLKTNTKYYYRVSVKDSDIGYFGSFKTSDTPRILSVNGIGNVRDIGNWETADGKRIKQGLLYRGTELEGIVEPDYKITEEGKDTLLNVLGIRYDMDLRGSYDNPTNIDMLDGALKHKYYDCVMYKAIFTDVGKIRIKEIFTDLANPNNYPMYMHCTYGLDRTGTVCYLLEGFLGISDEDLKRDYELSALFHFSYNADMYETMVTALQAYEGDTTQEKITNYLLECGITEDQLQSIREIFLED